jgi:hypothetical protein
MLKKIIKMLHENQHTLAIHSHMINVLVQSSSIARESSQLPVNLIPINSVAEFDELEIKLQAGNVAKALVSH